MKDYTNFRPSLNTIAKIISIDGTEITIDHFAPFDFSVGTFNGTIQKINVVNNVKIKMINHEGLPNNEFNVWDKDIESANNQGNVPLPHINYKSKARDIRSTLLYFLGKNGIKDTNISYTYGGDGIDIDLDLEYSKKEEVEEKLKKNKL